MGIRPPDRRQGEMNSATIPPWGSGSRVMMAIPSRVVGRCSFIRHRVKIDASRAVRPRPNGLNNPLFCGIICRCCGIAFTGALSALAPQGAWGERATVGRLAPRESPHHAASWLGLPTGQYAGDRLATVLCCSSWPRDGLSPVAWLSFAHSLPLLSCYLLEETPCPPPCSSIRRPWLPRHPPAAPVGPANCGSAPAVSPSRLIPPSAPPPASRCANSTPAAGNTSSITSAAPNTAACRPTRSPRAIPYSAEQCVALTEEDLATLEPTDDKTIHLEHFLSPTEFDLTLLAGRSLYLAPAHPAAMKPSS